MLPAKWGYAADQVVFGRKSLPALIAAALQRNGDTEAPLPRTRLARLADHDAEKIQRMKRSTAGKLRPPDTFHMPGVWTCY